MQKIIQRRVAAEAQVARRAQRGAANKESDKIWVTRYQAKERRAMVAVNVKNERKHRREDWDCGPRLAPQRSAGTGFESYGVVEQNAVQQPERTKKERKGLWAAEGDRVVILKGRDMGRIGTVKNADWEAESVTVKGMNLVRFFAVFAHCCIYTGLRDIGALLTAFRATGQCPKPCV